MNDEACDCGGEDDTLHLGLWTVVGRGWRVASGVQGKREAETVSLFSERDSCKK